MITSADSGDPNRPPTDVTVRFRPMLLGWQVAWVVIAVLALGANLAGILPRVRELMQPCLAEPCLGGQFTAAMQAELLARGLSPEAYYWYLEGLANVMVLVSLSAAIFIFWPRRDSHIGFVASLFLILVSNSATFNWDALVRAYPATEILIHLLQSLAGIAVAAMFYQFPNGQFSPRWARWVVVGWGVFYGLMTIVPGLWQTLNRTDANVAGLLGLAVYLGGVAAQVHRYRKVSTPLERQQTKWVVIAIAIQVLAFGIILAPIPQTASHLIRTVQGVVTYHLYVITFLLIPVALFIAIRRYRLWDIDFLINRSLIYGALTAALLAAFAASVFVLRIIFGWLTGGVQSPLALGLSMLVVGLAFQPTRQWLKHFVDRRFYGIEIDYERAAKKYHAQKVFEGPRLTSLGEYGKLELIGRGGMAEVYRATHPTLKRPIAIKILSRELAAQSPEYYKRFEREARALTILQHPNVIHLHEYATTDDGVLYMVMDYIAGSDLSDYLKRHGRLDLRQALPILQDVADALDFAHAHDLVHRDVKPSNILLTPVTANSAGRTHRAVLTDFGIAKLKQATQLTNTSIVGTFDYIAPEQIKDAAEVDGRADIYALGVVAYHTLTGRCPFSGVHPAALLIAHLQQPPPDPRDVAPGLRQHTARAIQRALAKDPIERFRTAGELVAALGAGVSEAI